MNDSVDILLATYNGERYIHEQIASIQLQTHSRWQLLVSDDCSSDRTLGIVRDIELIDNRIHVVSGGKHYGGATANYMALLSRSKAPYVMFCNQDDIWLPEKIERVLACMKKMEAENGGKTPLLVFSDLAVVDENLALLNSSFERYSHRDPSRTQFAQLLEANVAVGCTMILNRCLVDLCTRGIDVSAISMHDWLIMLVASAFGRVGYVDEPLLLCRQYGANKQGATEYNALRKSGIGDSRATLMQERINQATQFYEIYGDELDDVNKRRVCEYVAIGCSNIYTKGDSSLYVGRNLETELAEVGGTTSGGYRNGEQEQNESVGENGFNANWRESWKCEVNRDSSARKTSRTIPVAAGIVTYNPEKELLLENLKAISPQVKEVIIFDNGSYLPNVIKAVASTISVEMPGTVIKVLECPENIGMAGALNGIAMAATFDECSHVLFLDQDSVAGPELVSAELQHVAEDVGIVCPIIVDRGVEASGISSSSMTRTGLVRRAITSGSLVNLEVLRAVGGYDERLFIDWVDHEFCANLEVHGYKIVCIDEAYIMHEVGKKEYAGKTIGRDANRHLTLIPYFRTNHSYFRRYDKFRSMAIVRRKYARTSVSGWLLKSDLKSMVRAIVYEKRKAEMVRAIVLGTLDGLLAYSSCEVSQST